MLTKRHAVWLLLLASTLPTLASALDLRRFDMRTYLLESHPWLVQDLLAGEQVVLSELACMADVPVAALPQWRHEMLATWRQRPDPFGFADAWFARYPGIDWVARRAACD